MKKIYFSLFLLVLGILAQAQTADIFDLARTGSAAHVKQLLTANPKLVNATNAEGYAPLTLACYRGNNGVAKILVESGANIDAVSGMGTALMASIVKSNEEMVRFLVERKANPNLTDGNGTTALLYAVMFKKHDFVSLLMKAGANPQQKDDRGQSAIDYAVAMNDDKLIELLKTKKL